uniref:DH domain-containing protein n=1 Tax=Electrophorus electricus TaxID=8005 RepID=A0A4W4EBZ0_ELEEL
MQNSMYEVFTSEQMYLDGLTVAVDHFQNSQELNSVLTSIDILFIPLSMAMCVSSFLSLMVQKLDSSLFCDVICDVVHQYATGPFDFYVDYIRNMPYQNCHIVPRVVEVLSKLEEHPCCNRLPLESFLCLPFQRISRLKILMEVISTSGIIITLAG